MILPAFSPFLVADIGGTTTRVAAALGAGEFTDVEVAVADQDIVDPLELLLEVRNRLTHCEYGAVAVAGRVEDDEVQLTNRDFNFSISKLEQQLQLRKLLVVNDFVALAHAIDALPSDGVHTVRQGERQKHSPLVVCGPGTGFGLAVLYADGNVVSTEAGHLRLGSFDREEAYLLERISGKGLDRPIVEDVISGKGLQAIYQAISGRDQTPESIVKDAESGISDAKEAIDRFLRFFGRIVADLSLLFDARGGVFIAGGVGSSLSRFYSSASFMRWFETHPTNGLILSRVPIHVVTYAFPGLLGAEQLLERNLKSGRWPISE